MNDFFDDDKDFEFEDIIKKTKRINNLKMVGISIMIFFLLFGAVYFANKQMVSSIREDQNKFLVSYYSIFRPNEYIGSIKSTGGFFENTMDYTTYKIIDNKPVFGGNYSVKTGIFDAGVYDDGYLINSIFLGQDPNTGGHVQYSQMGYKLMRFYHPMANYYREPNEIMDMANLNDESYAEVAISFNKSFSLDQAYDLIPRNLNISWYWIDSYSEDELSEHKKFAKSGKSDYIGVEGVVGINGINRFGEEVRTTNPNGYNLEQVFLDQYLNGLSLKHLKTDVFSDIEENLDLGYLKDKINIDGIHSSDQLKLQKPLDIIGVVVTGKVGDIRAFGDNPNIKASVLGYSE